MVADTHRAGKAHRNRHAQLLFTGIHFKMTCQLYFKSTDRERSGQGGNRGSLNLFRGLKGGGLAELPSHLLASWGLAAVCRGTASLSVHTDTLVRGVHVECTSELRVEALCAWLGRAPCDTPSLQVQ